MLYQVVVYVAAGINSVNEVRAYVRDTLADVIIFWQNYINESINSETTNQSKLIIATPACSRVKMAFEKLENA